MDVYAPHFDTYTAKAEGWADYLEIVAEIPTSGEGIVTFNVEPGYYSALIAVVSVPSGMATAYPTDLTMRVKGPQGCVSLSTNTDTEYFGFLRPKAEDTTDDTLLFIEMDPGRGLIGRVEWEFNISSGGELPFAVNILALRSETVIQDTFQRITQSVLQATQQGMAFTFPKCLACKSLSKAIAVGIVAAGASHLAIPVALIGLVAGFLHVSTQIASLVIHSLLGSGEDAIATELCRRTGLCPAAGTGSQQSSSSP